MTIVTRTESTNQGSCRRPLPQGIHQPSPTDLQAAVSRVRAHLLPSLPGGGAPGTGAASQYELQTLRVVHRRASVGEWEGFLGPVRGSGGEYVAQRLDRVRDKVAGEGGSSAFAVLV